MPKYFCTGCDNNLDCKRTVVVRHKKNETHSHLTDLFFESTNKYYRLSTIHSARISATNYTITPCLKNVAMRLELIFMIFFAHNILNVRAPKCVHNFPHHRCTYCAYFPRTRQHPYMHVVFLRGRL